MKSKTTDDRPPYAIAMEWVARVTTISLEMFIPGLIGQWLDKRWGTQWLTLVGFVFGFTAGMWHLLLIARQAEQKRLQQKQDQDDSTDINKQGDDP